MLTNIKRRSALLLSVAVVCATVALVPQSASAAAWAPNATGVDVPGSTTAYKACPNTSAPAAGFTDTTSTSVDCIKMFGITSGTTATTYSPADPVSRWQMALFLSRMYTPTGITAGTGTFTAFTDIGDLSSEIQTAVNAIAASGVTIGTSAGVYSPNDNVTRAEMAIFLNRMTDILTDNDADNNGTPTALGGTAANGGYNYTDIANQSHEAVLSIIENYDMGIAEDACTAGTCDSTYRPSDDITRLEMAEMMHRLLNHTNARPAGVSIQTPTTAAAGATMATQISVRNADFTPDANTIVDVMRHTDTVASALDNTAYHALTGLCDAAIVVGTGTECAIDAADAVTNLLGNAAGPSAGHAASQTIEWTAWTGTAGAVYVNDTTVANKEVSTLGAAATFVSATTGTLTTSARAAATAYNLSASDLVTDNDGEYTPFGEAVTLTVTLTGASTAAVVDGYSVTFAETRADSLGNRTTSSSAVLSSGGAASYTVAGCADPVPAVVGNANLGSWCSSEVTITMAGTGTGAATGTYQPLGHQGTNVTLTGLTSGGYNTSWSDAAAVYTTGSDTLAISTNHALVSTTGTLIDATATAYDQYGRGMPGQNTRFSVGGAGAVTATSGANGAAIYSFVACTTNGTVAVATTKDAGEAMSAQGATAPSATAEGTTVHCSTAATDGAFGNVAEVREVFTITTDAAGGTDLGGTYTLAYAGGGASGNIAYNANAGAMGTGLDATTLAANQVECVDSTASGDNGTFVTTCTGAVGTGDLGAFTCNGASLTGTGDKTCTIAVTRPGVNGNTSHFVDHDAADSSFIGKRVNTGINCIASCTTEGVTSAAVTTYIKYLYGEAATVFETIPTSTGAGGAGATAAQFVAEMGVAAQTDCEVNGTIRNGVLTTGVDAFRFGFRADGTTECGNSG